MRLWCEGFVEGVEVRVRLRGDVVFWFVGWKICLLIVLCICFSFFGMISSILRKFSLRLVILFLVSVFLGVFVVLGSWVCRFGIGKGCFIRFSILVGFLG